MRAGDHRDLQGTPPAALGDRRCAHHVVAALTLDLQDLCMYLVAMIIIIRSPHTYLSRTLKMTKTAKRDSEMKANASSASPRSTWLEIARSPLRSDHLPGCT